MAVGRGTGFGAIGALAVLAVAGRAASQEEVGPALHSALLVADATEADARVTITYSLRVPAGVERVPLTVLSPEPTALAALTVRPHARVRSSELPASPTAQRSGALELEPSRQTEDLEIALSYTVTAATTADGDRSRVILPVVAVDWPPAQALPGTFRARVQLPLDMVAYEAFPTPSDGLAREGTDPGPTELELSVLPAYVSVRARRGGAPALSVPGVADAAVVVLLLVLGFWGWRTLQSSLAGREA